MVTFNSQQFLTKLSYSTFTHLINWISLGRPRNTHGEGKPAEPPLPRAIIPIRVTVPRPDEESKIGGWTRRFLRGELFSRTRDLEEVLGCTETAVIKRWNNDHCPKRDKRYWCCIGHSAAPCYRHPPRGPHTERCRQLGRVLERDSLLPIPLKNHPFARRSLAPIP